MATWFAQNSTVNIDSVNQWNSAANGSGSWLTWALLDAADILVANGKTGIVINVSFTCGSINTATSGGGFTVSASGLTITTTGLGVYAGTTTCITFTGSAGTTLTINGIVTHYGSTSTKSVYCSSTGTLNVSGEVTNHAFSAGNAWAIDAASATVNITGNVTASDSTLGGGTGSNHGVVVGSGVLTITGNLQGGKGNNPDNAVVTSGTTTVIGNVTGSAVTTGSGISCTGGILNITGAVYGGTSTGFSPGCTVSGGTVTVTGNVYGGSGASTGYGIYISGGTTTINGDLVAASTVTAAAGYGRLIMRGSIISHSSGMTGYGGLKLTISSTELTTHYYRQDVGGVVGVSRTLTTAGANQAATADVRSGTSYGGGTGTLAVPSPTLVAIGVSTDNTVGSYNPSVNASDIRTAVGLAAANLDTQLSGIQSDTNDIQTRLPAALESGRIAAALDSATATKIDAILEDTGTTLPAAIAATATPAQVNAQVLDVLSVDTFGELGSPPAATSSLKDKLVWLFMWARNKATETSTQRKLFADDTTTVVSTETVGDDGVTFTKDKAS